MLALSCLRLTANCCPRWIIFAALSALLSLGALQGQTLVSLEEAKIRAFLKNGSTVVSIPILNSADHPVKAHLTLGWLATNERESSRIEKDIVIARGLSTVETALPLSDPTIWTRLRYSVFPDSSEAKTFGPIRGLLSLPYIADYAFEVKASIPGTARRGSSITLHAEAVHPVSRLPISGADWEATLRVDNQKLTPKQINRRQEGFVDFVFDVPLSPSSDPDEEATVEVTAKRGDFQQSLSEKLNVPARLSGHFQSDKPIYQPGQTLHMRAALQDAQGRAAADAKVSLRVEDEDHQRVHTAQLVASKFGVVQNDWELPASASLGTYSITLTAADDDSYQIARHVVRVSRYELPTFHVTVKPDRSTYLPAANARVTISAAYLFGKPVPSGHVRLVRSLGPRWNAKNRKFEAVDELVAEGEAKPDGTFVTEVSLKAEHEELKKSDGERFKNVHFAAYFTDTTSHRTEQRRFDLRITREPIHVYLLRTNGGGSLPAPVYVATSYADGRPASTDVEIQLRGKAVRVRTNRYGIGKVDQFRSEDFENGASAKAADAAGQTGTWVADYWRAGSALLRLQTNRTMHRAGEAVTLQITSPPEAPADQAVMIHALAGDRKVATRIVQLTKHQGQVTFPYQAEFRRAIVFVAWNGVEPRRDYQDRVLGSKTVVFPDGADLVLAASVGRAVYKPGEQASVRLQVSTQDGKPVEAALALAVVDQAVLERARTDSDFGHRPWFACAFCTNEGEAEIGGIRLNDLYAVKTNSPITPELDLVAEALVARASAFLWSESSPSVADMPTYDAVTSQIKQLSATLDQHYSTSLEFPEDLATLALVLGRQWSDLVDPWGRPYRATFSVDREHRVVSLLSSGPDKSFGTVDDFLAGSFRRPYFTPIQHLIRQTLRKLDDYPSTVEEFVSLLRQDGILLTSLRDPWNTPYRVEVITTDKVRRIILTSAGADKAFATDDDFIIASFSGLYFRRETLQISGALKGVAPAPQSIDDFQTAMRRAGIEIGGFRDAWGKPYRLASIVSSRYTDRMVTTTTRVFGGPVTPRTETTPVTQKFIIFSLRSDGPDALENTYDDFDIAQFFVLQTEESAAPTATASSNTRSVANARGTGAISGTVTDASGAVIPNVSLTLFDAAKTAYEARSDQEGIFHFTSLPGGVYSLQADLTGFMRYEVSNVPVAAGKTTSVDIELQVGAVAETVTVELSAATLQTEAASVSASSPMATPRVREYFPETLLWLPELLTDQSGGATSRFALADSVTTWKVAAFASTLDGRVAEANTEFQTFQPIFLDFNPPPTLTEGDQIELPVAVRNYQDRAQSVGLALQANDWSTTVGSAAKRVSVPAESSVHAGFVIQAKRRLAKAPLRIVAAAGRKGDAIEKSVRVRPDGQEVARTLGDFAVGKSTFAVQIPAGAIPNASLAEMRIYPNFASLLLESAAAILTTPHGCAEQTISGGHANLVALRFARAAGIADPRIENQALANIRLAVDGLRGFKNYQGGVGYWVAGEPDIAVTAYALSFLVEAFAVTPGNGDDLSQMVAWLEKVQAKDGNWLTDGRPSEMTNRQSLLLTATVARALASAQKAGVKVSKPVLNAAYHYLAQFTDQWDEPYILATFLLAALDSGQEAQLGKAIGRLTAMAREEQGGVYWNLQTNSPFYGWGTAGRYETTGLVLSALSAWKAKHAASAELDSFLRRGLVFVLRGRDASGGWFSTQSTLRVMRAIADASSALGQLSGQGGTFEIRTNGRLVKALSLPSDPKATDPLVLDLSAFLSSGDNQIAVESTSSEASALVRLTTSYWMPWEQAKPRSSAEFRFHVAFDRLDVRAGEPVRCSVKAERIGFRGYGMMLAEVGLPPGAEVDRSSLESVLADGAVGLDHYDILPDRVVLYLWPKGGGSTFEFFLTARNAMVSKSAASVLYDYYNPEAISELPPARWTVK